MQQVIRDFPNKWWSLSQEWPLCYYLNRSLKIFVSRHTREESKGLRWLHISDIHYYPNMDGTSTEQLRDTLLPYLQSLDEHVDQVFVTGDYRDASQQKDTDTVAAAAAQFIREIAAAVGVADPTNIHLVPGNHDLNKCQTDKSRVRLSNIIANFDVDKGVFAEKDQSFLLNRFSFFKKVDKCLHPAGSVWQATPMPLHAYQCFDGYSLIFLNTA